MRERDKAHRPLLVIAWFCVRSTLSLTHTFTHSCTHSHTHTLCLSLARRNCPNISRPRHSSLSLLSVFLFPPLHTLPLTPKCLLFPGARSGFGERVCVVCEREDPHTEEWLAPRTDLPPPGTLLCCQRATRVYVCVEGRKEEETEGET